ncbi:hypothetical protein CAB38_06340 [Xanthomonas citri pv. punicae]|uniref:Type IV secretion system protein VirB5 n=1 Tax=Xanthomonas campestris pv. malvacearum TaxID=86040 RepID=A0AA45BVE6_XANCM|nr:hypothetical protein APY29_08625 [Xanthomonas citri pv. malvacearum]MBE0315819.1 hypothetical protein [Xanthomonas citri pv. punicae]NMI13669.1 hypothetical protein [Xanthomonas citri]OOW64561.1 hypothetical protein Xths_02340 [Xanthomonas campestris pv. thespesiae]OOW74303.1 hypothetical protein Xmar_10540 [Xanthomonas axonopodis pv. martyniicola]OOW81085.1 hypothetical protein Xlen_09885 [Xanthomonas campestris pv. leeana]OOW94090.1 hypothetical protein Xvtr_12500 [Xanthomonas campestris
MSQEAKNTMAIKFRHFSRVFMGLVLLSMAGAASAQWEVVDKDLNEKVDQIRKNQTIKNGDGKESSGKEVEKPKETLKKVADDEGVAACSASTSGTPVSDSQRESCELIQRTRNSQFNYMVAMYEITTKRLERLRTIEEERKKIGDQKIGELESNTNKLLALKAMMDIDRQQMESAMFAYEKRLAFLTELQTGAAKAAMAGKEPPKGDGSSSWLPSWIPADLLSIGKTLVAGAVMKGAFEAIKSDTPAGMERLEIDKD